MRTHEHDGDEAVAVGDLRCPPPEGGRGGGSRELTIAHRCSGTSLSTKLVMAGSFHGCLEERMSSKARIERVPQDSYAF